MLRSSLFALRGAQGRRGFSRSEKGLRVSKFCDFGYGGALRSCDFFCPRSDTKNHEERDSAKVVRVDVGVTAR